MEETPEPFPFVIPPGAASGRADKVLAGCFPEFSRAHIQKSFDAGLVTLEDRPLKRRDKIGPGMELMIGWLPERRIEAHPVAIPLNILFEDEAIVVVNKEPGMVTHPGSGTGEETLVHALLHHTAGRLSPVGAPDRPGIVHRLDKETSGVIVVARTEAAHHALVRQFSERTLRKEYLAWVLGEPDPASGSIREPIDRHPVVRTRMTVAAGGRPAHTDWELLRAGQGAALLRCRIHTGRTHQIRVHLSHIGHPLLGDKTYGYKPRHRVWEPISRVMLHAEILGLAHPLSGESLAFQAPVPVDFEELDKRVGYTSGP
jgi:23S rRNA pseudouridine1911/1915/1917 synthase